MQKVYLAFKQSQDTLQRMIAALVAKHEIDPEKYHYSPEEGAFLPIVEETK